jgi:hypothetical protein
MLSILNPEPELGTAVKKKIAHVQIFGIPCVLGFYLLAMASIPMGYLPPWVFWLAAGAESLLCTYVMRKIHSLRKPS